MGEHTQWCDECNRCHACENGEDEDCDDAVFPCSNPDCGIEYDDADGAAKCCATCPNCGTWNQYPNDACGSCGCFDCCCGACPNCEEDKCSCGCDSEDCCPHCGDNGGDCGCQTFEQHQEIAAEFGIDPYRDLGQLVADYYLLQYLGNVLEVADAKARLTELCDELAPEFSVYLDFACGGEMRHVHRHYLDEELQEELPLSGTNHRRTDAWVQWMNWSTPEHRLDLARRAFYTGLVRVEGEWTRDNTVSYPWPRVGIGGQKWGVIADTALRYVRGQMSNEVFVDRVFNLQHNGGCCLNKAYHLGTVGYSLAAHGKDDYKTLLRQASSGVNELWQRRDADWLQLFQSRVERHMYALSSVRAHGAQQAYAASRKAAGAELAEVFGGSFRTTAFQRWASTTSE